MHRFKKMKSNIIVFFIVISFIIGNSMFLFANENIGSRDEVKTPSIKAEAAILINATTGEVLYSKNPDRKMYPASTTKMMTGLLIAESLKMDAEVVAPSNFKTPDLQGSHIAIDQSEKFNVEQLLNALLVGSANDAAVVLAIASAGSEKDFVDGINKRFESIGADSSHFVNSHGLHDDNHYTTARDLSLMATEFMKNPIVKKIVKKPNYTIPPTNKKKEERNYIRNTNWFINDNGNKIEYKGEKIFVRDENVIGVKTGYTDEAGLCLVSEIEFENRRYISVVLKSPSRVSLYEDSKKLLYYAIEGFKTYNIAAVDERIMSIKVDGIKNGELDLLSSDRIVKTLPIDFDLKDVEVVKELKEIPKEISANQNLGKVTFMYKDQNLGSVDLLAAHAVGKSDFLGEVTFALSSQSDLGIYLKILIYILKFLLALLVWNIYLSIKNGMRTRKMHKKFMHNIKRTK